MASKDRVSESPPSRGLVSSSSQVPVVFRWPWGTRWDFELSVGLVKAAALTIHCSGPVDVSAHPGELRVFGIDRVLLGQGLRDLHQLLEREASDVAANAVDDGPPIDLPEPLQTRWDRLQKQIDHVDELHVALFRRRATTTFHLTGATS